jgi:protein SCO1/2
MSLGHANSTMIASLAAVALLVGPGALAIGGAKPLDDNQLTRIGYEQHLAASLPLTIRFTDEQGRPVQLGNYFSTKPVILVMGYYRCPMLCTIVQNGLVECLADIRATVGPDYQVIYVSINPNDSRELAAGKKRATLKRYGRSESASGWHFLTGSEASITNVASTIGFNFAYDAASHEYAHPSGFVVLTPEGRISRYFLGVSFSAREVYSALQTAGNRTIGQKIQELVLLCFHYRPVTGRYGATVLIITRVLGAATVLGIGLLIISTVRRELRKEKVATAKKVDAEVVA